MIFHAIKDVLQLCPLCGMENQMKKLLTTPNIHVATTTDEEAEVGELTKEYIEANREILEQQKKEAKKRNYEPT
jgi:Na+/phosphate symporter